MRAPWCRVTGRARSAARRHSASRITACPPDPAPANAQLRASSTPAATWQPPSAFRIGPCLAVDTRIALVARCTGVAVGATRYFSGLAHGPAGCALELVMPAGFSVRETIPGSRVRRPPARRERQLATRPDRRTAVRSKTICRKVDCGWTRQGVTPRVSCSGTTFRRRRTADARALSVQRVVAVRGRR
jgi:hypothetical protein